MSGFGDFRVRLVGGASCLLLATLMLACDDNFGVSLGQIEVTVATTGADLDPNGYSLAIDGAAGLVIPVNTTKTLTGLSSGTHSVLLAGLTSNCTVSGDNPRSVDTGHGLTAHVAFAVTCVAITGSVVVMVATTGVELDPDGYMVRVDGGTGEYAPLNAATIFNGVLAGTHSVSLDGVAANCTVGPSNPRSVDVVVGTRIQIAFSVTCVTTVGSLAVTVGTTGADLDPDGYTVSVDGATGLRVSVNGSVTVAGLKAGTHTVLLADLTPNCVPGVNPRSVDIVVGATGQIAFAVSCAATTGTLRVTTNTAGVDLDIDGYSANVDGAAGPAVPVNGTVTIPRVLGGSRNVALSGISSNCAVSGANPRSVTVTIGETTAVAFAIQCAKADRIAFVSAGDIYVMNADGSGVVRLTNNGAWDPAWSPDGTKIALTSTRDGNSEIYVMNADGSGVVRLTNNASADFQPAWAPDGSKVIFVSQRDGHSEIYLMNADGTGVVRLSNTFNIIWNGQPAWSPDGAKIAFVSNRDDGQGEIYVMNADGSGVVRLTSNPSWDGEPAWSPDGTHIAFASTRDGGYQIYVMNADGSSVRRLTNDSDDENPTWSPNGSTIAFANLTFSTDWQSYTYYYSSVYTVKADGSGLSQLQGTNTGADSQPAWRR